MKCRIVSQTGSDAAVVFFTGWSCDAGPFEDMTVPGYDVIVVWDYADFGLETSCLETYREIVVAAWSFGAIAASRFLTEHPELPVTLTIAFNSTLCPADDFKGIPTAIFEGTLNGLSERSLTKFRRRMGAGTDFTECLEPADIDSLKHQLQNIRREAGGKLFRRWDHVYISSEDRIIPPQNQHRFWDETAAILHNTDGQHLPTDIGATIASLAVDKQLVKERFGSCASTYDDNAPVQHEIAARLVTMVPDDVRDVVEIGCGTGVLTAMLRDRLPSASVTPVDISPSLSDAVCDDGELYLMRLPDSSLDLVISSSTVQWFNSPSCFLQECARVLRHGGMALISTFGPDTYKELRGHGAPTLAFTDTDRWRRIAADFFESAEVTEESIVMTFDSPHELMRHIKLTGVNAVTRGGVTAARRLLKELTPGADGRCRLTYNPIYLKLTIR